MKTVLLTKESFLKHMGRSWETNNPLYYCYVCEEIFRTETARYIYGRQIELPPEKKEKVWGRMWEIAQREQEKHPELTHILAIQGFSDESGYMLNTEEGLTDES